MDADLDTLAGALRERLLAAAGEGDEGAGPEQIRALVDREAGVLDASAREGLAARIAERAFGLGPLEPLLADPEVEEIMVSGTRHVWVERGGRLERTEIAFEHEADLREAIERILSPPVDQAGQPLEHYGSGVPGGPLHQLAAHSLSSAIASRSSDCVTLSSMPCAKKPQTAPASAPESSVTSATSRSKRLRTCAWIPGSDVAT